MQTILTVFQVFLSLGIIGLVLIQHGKGADAGAAFGSGASATVFGSRGSGSFLSRATGILAALFFLTSIGLAYYAAQGGRPAGLMDGVAPVAVEGGDAGAIPVAVPQAPASEVPAVPGLAPAGNAGEVPAIAGPVPAAVAPASGAGGSGGDPEGVSNPAQPQGSVGGVPAVSDPAPGATKPE